MSSLQQVLILYTYGGIDNLSICVNGLLFFQRDRHLMFWHVCSSLKCWHKGTWSKCYRLNNGVQRYLGPSFSVLIPQYFAISSGGRWTEKWQHLYQENMDSLDSQTEKHLKFLKTIRKCKERSCFPPRWHKSCSVNCYINRGIPFYCQKGICCGHCDHVFTRWSSLPRGRLEWQTPKFSPCPQSPSLPCTPASKT